LAVDSDYGNIARGSGGSQQFFPDQGNDYTGEDFEGFTITKFDGTTITV